MTDQEADEVMDLGLITRADLLTELYVFARELGERTSDWSAGRCWSDLASCLVRGEPLRLSERNVDLLATMFAEHDAEWSSARSPGVTGVQEAVAAAQRGESWLSDEWIFFDAEQRRALVGALASLGRFEADVATRVLQYLDDPHTSFVNGSAVAVVDRAASDLAVSADCAALAARVQDGAAVFDDNEIALLAHANRRQQSRGILGVHPVPQQFQTDRVPAHRDLIAPRLEGPKECTVVLDEEQRREMIAALASLSKSQGATVGHYLRDLEGPDLLFTDGSAAQVINNAARTLGRSGECAALAAGIKSGTQAFDQGEIGLLAEAASRQWGEGIPDSMGTVAPQLLATRPWFNGFQEHIADLVKEAEAYRAEQEPGLAPESIHPASVAGVSAELAATDESWVSDAPSMTCVGVARVLAERLAEVDSWLPSEAARHPGVAEELEYHLAAGGPRSESPSPERAALVWAAVAGTLHGAAWALKWPSMYQSGTERRGL